MSITKKPLLLAVLGVAFAVAGVAQGGSFIHYSGWSTQKAPVRFHGPVKISLTSTHTQRLLLFTITLKCTPKAKIGYTATSGASVDANGYFKHNVPKSSPSHLSSFAGRVAGAKVTGSFVASRHGCQARGKFSARKGDTYPPKPSP